MVVFRSCPRCGLNPVSRAAYIIHLNRKKLCAPTITNNDLQKEYIEFRISDKIDTTKKMQIAQSSTNNDNDNNDNNTNNNNDNDEDVIRQLKSNEIVRQLCEQLAKASAIINGQYVSDTKSESNSNEDEDEDEHENEDENEDENEAEDEDEDEDENENENEEDEDENENENENEEDEDENENENEEDENEDEDEDENENENENEEEDENEEDENEEDTNSRDEYVYLETESYSESEDDEYDSEDILELKKALNEHMYLNDKKDNLTDEEIEKYHAQEQRLKDHRIRLKKNRKKKKQQENEDTIKIMQDMTNSINKLTRDELFPNGFKAKTDKQIDEECENLYDIVCEFCGETYSTKCLFETHCKECEGMNGCTNSKQYYLGIINSLLNATTSRNDDIIELNKQVHYLEEKINILTKTNEVNVVKERDVIVLTKEDIDPRDVNHTFITNLLDNHFTCHDNEHSNTSTYIYIPNASKKYMLMYDDDCWTVKENDDYKYIDWCFSRGNIIKFELNEWILKRRLYPKYNNTFDMFLLNHEREKDEEIKTFKIELLDLITFIDKELTTEMKKISNIFMNAMTNDADNTDNTDSNLITNDT
jgi:chemotaxis protein histidine kinase CheA